MVAKEEAERDSRGGQEETGPEPSPEHNLIEEVGPDLAEDLTKEELRQKYLRDLSQQWYGSGIG